MHAAAQKRERAAAASGAAVGGEAAQAVTKAASAAEASAQKATHATALVDAQSMGQRYQSELEDALASVRTKHAGVNTPQTLHVRSRKPINAFEAWPAAFVQFFCGDCAPVLDRPRLVGFRHLFECKLSSDETDQLLPGGCQRAPPHAGTFQSSRQCSQTLCAKGPYSPQRSTHGRTAPANGASTSRPDEMRNWRTSSSWPPSSRSCPSRLC